MAKTPRWLFLWGSLWNFWVAGSILIAPDAMAKLFYGASEGLSPLTRLALQDFGSAILLFGAGYLIVALNPAMNHGIILLGIVGKLGIAVVLPYRYLTGDARGWILIPALVDLLFAILFARYLLAITQSDR